MRRPAMRHRLTLVAVLAMVALAATSAHATANHVRCRERIALESARFLQTRLKALTGCEEFVVKGKHPGPCPDAVAAGRIAKAESQLRARIERSCGGGDRTCGNLDDTLLGLVGWDVGTCPDLEGAGCTNAIADCHDVAECLRCVGSSATDQLVTLYGDEFTPSSPGTTLNTCQVRIVKEAQRFARSRSKALQKCWRSVSRERGIAPCPVPGDGKAELAITKAHDKMVDEICSGCGGGDGFCDGLDDLDVTAIGFAPTCPDVTRPDGVSCARSVATLDDLVDCLDCLGGFGVDCTSALAVPWGVAYPGVCQPAP